MTHAPSLGDGYKYKRSLNVDTRLNATLNATTPGLRAQPADRYRPAAFVTEQTPFFLLLDYI